MRPNLTLSPQNIGLFAIGGVIAIILVLALAVY